MAGNRPINNYLINEKLIDDMERINKEIGTDRVEKWKCCLTDGKDSKGMLSGTE